ncbi:DUF6894 family protein [Bradyrhizobium sp. Arg816]|uniref:DUF6894 family protein n=1 Tax=Bradyrhizobium sp. Arg816 TaxID=2998491 RepID=UPI00249ED618|nr:hypothetical protein [Bradyrhizobium sp. Arg816]MDI3561970.1 hypothetical protein [Bradyrhizobium sp. Arg816]
MPRFFINHTSLGEICVDDIGVEFSSLEAAYLDTCEAALTIAFEKLRERQDPTSDAFEIIDDKKNVLMQVPFSEVLRPSAVRHISSIKRENALALENCRRQAARSERLKDEIRAEFTRTRRIFDAIRANLSAFHAA